MTDMTKETATTTPVTTPPVSIPAGSAKKTPSSEGKIEENEIRVTAQGKMRNYVAYAATIFSEGKSHTVVLKGMGRVINKTVSLAEILKRRVKGLYQLAEIGSIQVMDKKIGRADEEPVDVLRLLSVIKIVLTTEPEEKAKYQAPVDEAQVEPLMTPTPKRGRPGRSRKKPKKVDREAKEDSSTKENPPKEEPATGDAAESGKDHVKGSEKDSGGTGDEKAGTKPKSRRRNNRKPRKGKKDATEKTTTENGVAAEAKKEEPDAKPSTESTAEETAAA